MSKTHLRVVTNSERTTARRCMREHHLAYDLGYRPIEDKEALRFGSMMHAGLEPRWLGVDIEQAIEIACAKAVDEFEAARTRVLLRGYHLRWADDDLSQVVGVEVEFRAPLINPETGAASRTWQLGGKIDVLFRNSFMEHKTTSKEIGVGSVYWRKLTLDPQVSSYYAGGKSLGYDIQECTYDVIRKIALRPSQVPLVDDSGYKIVLDANGERVYCKVERKGVGPKPRETGDAKLGYVLQTRPETVEEYEARITEEVASNPDKYFQRGTVVRLEKEEHEAMQDTWQLTRAMREAEVSGSFPRNPDACERFGSLCPFFAVCTGTASLDDASLYERVDNVHQELTFEAAQ
jgi:hypothetical protein